MITRAEILMGRDKEYPLNHYLEENLAQLLASLNKFRKKFGRSMFVTSGYRPGPYNAAAGGSKASNHCVLLATDFKDADGKLATWCLANLDVLADCGLWIESPEHTKGWVHLQCVPPKSGNRVFKP